MKTIFTYRKFKYSIILASLITAIGFQTAFAAPPDASAGNMTSSNQLNGIAETGILTVEIADVDAARGDILIGVFGSFSAYENDLPTAEKIIRAKEGNISTTFSHLPIGEYAIKVLHDEDRDKELDLSIIGIPSEDYGFSRNARDPFSQPEWDEAKFPLTTVGYTSSITIK